MRLEPHLQRRSANHRPLTPLDFLERAVSIFPERRGIVWRERAWTYGEFGRIVAAMADFLRGQGVVAGDVVSVMCGNRPEMLAAHYAIPMIGAVLNSINTRLDQETVAYILGHSESRLIIADPTAHPVAAAAAAEHGVPVFRLAETGFADASGDLHLLDVDARLPADLLSEVTDEWQPICLNYTSGTTGKPKGVVYDHRGAYLNATGNVFAMKFDSDTSYLWILPMFHCDGWCHTWAVTAGGGLHVCLDRPDPSLIFTAIARHRITHMACAPVVLYMLLNHPDRAGRDPGRRVTVATGGASPTSALISEMEAMGFDLIHLYGLTESYGPVTMRILSDAEMSLGVPAKAALLARQGTRHLTANRVRVTDEHGVDVPHDGITTGEIMLYGNTLMMGYYRDPDATEHAFADGMFHTGDLAVCHPDGQIEIKDRSKDVIISGGENISSLELESVLHQHPAVLLAAVVAAPDPKWGEIPVAFIETRTSVSADELKNFCRERLAGFKQPRLFLFQELPKTATGKIQKFVLRGIARKEIESRTST